MNKTRIYELLGDWKLLIRTGENISKAKAEKIDGGLTGRIRRTTGGPVVFDLETYENQKRIQDALCQELAQWSDVIRSQPMIMDGYPWTRNDFIELYFNHFRLVIEKLNRIIGPLSIKEKNK